MNTIIEKIGRELSLLEVIKRHPELLLQAIKSTSEITEPILPKCENCKAMPDCFAEVERGSYLCYENWREYKRKNG